MALQREHSEPASPAKEQHTTSWAHAPESTKLLLAAAHFKACLIAATVATGLPVLPVPSPWRPLLQVWHPNSFLPQNPRTYRRTLTYEDLAV